MGGWKVNITQVKIHIYLCCCLFFFFLFSDFQLIIFYRLIGLNDFDRKGKLCFHAIIMYYVLFVVKCYAMENFNQTKCFACSCIAYVLHNVSISCTSMLSLCLRRMCVCANWQHKVTAFVVWIQFCIFMFLWKAYNFPRG